MMLRITPTLTTPHATTIALEGKLLGPWVLEVQNAVARAKVIGKVSIDLTELRYADRDGIALLHALQRDGIELGACSPFIASLLDTHPSRS